MEAVVANLRPDARLLVLENGKFGERFEQIARLWFGDRVDVLRSPAGRANDLAAAEARLQRGDVTAVLAVLNESSTGVQNPGEALAKLCRDHDALFLADGVTAVGGIDVPIDKWDVDACVVGSQKCLGAPPGATLLSLSDAYLEQAQPRTLYMDLKTAAAKWSQAETPFTPATHLYVAVAEALDLLAEETLEARLRRTHRLALALRAGLRGLELPLFADPTSASDTVTAVAYPPGATEKDVRDVLKQEFGIAVAGGQGDLAGRIFRVGHMGYVGAREIAALLACLEAALARTAHAWPRGASVTAFFDAWAGKAGG